MLPEDHNALCKLVLHGKGGGGATARERERGGERKRKRRKERKGNCSIFFDNSLLFLIISHTHTDIYTHTYICIRT